MNSLGFSTGVELQGNNTSIQLQEETILATAASSITQSNSPLFSGSMIPDLTCTLNILSSIMDGSTFEFVIIDVYEVAGDATSGEITVTMPKDPNLTFTYDTNMVLAGPYVVNNADWTYDGTNSAFHVWTTSNAINANGKSSIGVLFNYVPNGDGITTYAASVFLGSGGETNGSNNSDNQTVTYFQQ